jgi:hypothetical protein
LVGKYHLLPFLSHRFHPLVFPSERKQKIHLAQGKKLDMIAMRIGEWLMGLTDLTDLDFVDLVWLRCWVGMEDGGAGSTMEAIQEMMRVLLCCVDMVEYLWCCGWLLPFQALRFNLSALRSPPFACGY